MNKYFKREEFACKCGCGFSAVDAELLEVLTDLRGFYNTPVRLNSACRCEKHNKTVGGEPNSMHIKGIAADIVVKGIHPYNVYKYLDGKYPDKYGIGLYDSWVHIDVRSKPTRWDKS